MNGGTPLETRPCMAGSNPILIAQGIFRLSALGVGDCGFKSHFLDLGGGDVYFIIQKVPAI